LPLIGNKSLSIICQIADDDIVDLVCRRGLTATGVSELDHVDHYGAIICGCQHQAPGICYTQLHHHHPARRVCAISELHMYRHPRIWAWRRDFPHAKQPWNEKPSGVSCIEAIKALRRLSSRLRSHTPPPVAPISTIARRRVTIMAPSDTVGINAPTTELTSDHDDNDNDKDESPGSPHAVEMELDVDVDFSAINAVTAEVSAPSPTSKFVPVEREPSDPADGSNSDNADIMGELASNTSLVHQSTLSSSKGLTYHTSASTLSQASTGPIGGGIVAEPIRPPTSAGTIRPPTSAGTISLNRPLTSTGAIASNRPLTSAASTASTAQSSSLGSSIIVTTNEERPRTSATNNNGGMSARGSSSTIGSKSNSNSNSNNGSSMVPEDALSPSHDTLPVASPTSITMTLSPSNDELNFGNYTNRASTPILTADVPPSSIEVTPEAATISVVDATPAITTTTTTSD
jgi:hypothetical protein